MQPVNDSDDSDEDDLGLSSVDIRCLIAKWSVDNNIPHTKLSSLLAILKQHECFSNFPVSATTLLKTMTSSTIKAVGNGTCGKCTVEGVYDGNVIFDDFSSPLRTDEGFRTKADPEHHTGSSPLENIPNTKMREAQQFWSLVEFYPDEEDETHPVCAVPSNWIRVVDNVQICLYPSKRTKPDATSKLIRKGAIPEEQPKIQWEQYRINRILNRNPINLRDESLSKKHRAERHKKSMESSSDEGSEVEANAYNTLIPPPPELQTDAYLISSDDEYGVSNENGASVQACVYQALKWLVANHVANTYNWNNRHNNELKHPMAGMPFINAVFEAVHQKEGMTNCNVPEVEKHIKNWFRQAVNRIPELRTRKSMAGNTTGMSEKRNHQSWASATTRTPPARRNTSTAQSQDSSPYEPLQNATNQALPPTSHNNHNANHSWQRTPPTRMRQPGDLHMSTSSRNSHIHNGNGQHQQHNSSTHRMQYSGETNSSPPLDLHYLATCYIITITMMDVYK
ncbi:hypothetical protein B566_EDAN017009 [Ephemera danica]|nr:hypothetical protein B566_EDAN017009 [Ephemera danica]